MGQSEGAPTSVQTLGCRRRFHPSLLALLNSLLPAQMEPEVGFEPTTFRLRVEEPSSSGYLPDPSWLLTSAGSSVACVAGLPCYGWGNDQENDPADGPRRWDAHWKAPQGELQQLTGGRRPYLIRLTAPRSLGP